jgi:hypothetical protein
VLVGLEEKTLEDLETLKERGEQPSMAQAMRAAINLNRFLSDQVEAGFDTIVVRDPRTGRERELAIPSLQRQQRRKEA